MKTLEYFSRVNLRLNFNKLGYLPRWIIVLIDFAILAVAFVFTHVIFKEIQLDYIKPEYSISFVNSLFVVNLFFFWLFKTYSGIIRHASYTDAIKLLFSQIGVLIVFLVFNYLFEIVYKEKAFLNTAFLINIVLSYCGLLLYRIIVRKIFELYFTASRGANLINIIIYGTDANAISVANALKFETPSRFNIVGFVDKNNKNGFKRMLDLPILVQREKWPVLMRSVGAKGVVIADKSLSKEEQLVIVDQLLEFNYKIYVLPSISDWENQKEISLKVKHLQIEDLLERAPIVLDCLSISKQLKGNTILITGAAGSIGSEIVRQVLKFGPSIVILLDQAETPLYHISLEVEGIKESTIIHTCITDIRNRAALEKVFKLYRPHIVYHAAGYKHVPLMEDNPSQAIITNVEGTKNVADLSCEYRVDKFVMMSSDKAVNPSNIMGASKRIAEKYVQSLYLKCQEKYGLDATKFITTRFGNVLGSNGSVVPLFSKQIEEGGPITITHPDIIRYFMTIPEACQLVLEAGSMGNGGEIYIFDMGKPVKIVDLARKMIMLAGLTPDKDIKITISGLRPGEKLYEELLNNTSNTLPTYHKKIMITHEMEEEYEDMHLEIDELIGMASFCDNHTIVAKMKAIVPEYISMNTIFTVLDDG